MTDPINEQSKPFIDKTELYFPNVGQDWHQECADYVNAKVQPLLELLAEAEVFVKNYDVLENFRSTEASSSAWLSKYSRLKNDRIRTQ